MGLFIGFGLRKTEGEKGEREEDEGEGHSLTSTLSSKILSLYKFTIPIDRHDSFLSVLFLWGIYTLFPSKLVETSHSNYGRKNQRTPRNYEEAPRGLLHRAGFLHRGGFHPPRTFPTITLHQTCWAWSAPHERNESAQSLEWVTLIGVKKGNLLQETAQYQSFGEADQKIVLLCGS